MVETDSFLGRFVSRSARVFQHLSGAVVEPTVINHYEHTGVEDTDLEPRTERALTEYLTVLKDVDRAAGADGLYLAVSQCLLRPFTGESAGSPGESVSPGRTGEVSSNLS